MDSKIRWGKEIKTIGDNAMNLEMLARQCIADLGKCETQEAVEDLLTMYFNSVHSATKQQERLERQVNYSEYNLPNEFHKKKSVRDYASKKQNKRE